MSSADVLRAAHIELPYQVLNSDPATIISVKCNRQEFYVARCYQNASTDVDGDITAAFIVRACNAHYQMLEALKMVEMICRDDGHFALMKMVRVAIAAAEAEAGR